MFIERICERENKLVKRLREIKREYPETKLLMYGGGGAKWCCR